MIVTQSARSALFFSFWTLCLVNISLALSSYSSTLVPSSASSSDYYGYAVAASDYYGFGTSLNTTILVIGAPQFDYYIGSPTSSKSGYARVYSCPTATSCVAQTLMTEASTGISNTNGQDSFGATVATANGFVVIGAPNYDDSGVNDILGAVFHYYCTPTCTYLGNGIGSVAFVGQVGSSVAVSYIGSDKWFIVAGANHYATSYGGFYSYTCTSSSCSPNVANLPFVKGSSGLYLGSAIAVWQTLIVASAVGYQSNQGQVLVYSVPTATPTATPSPLYTLQNPDSPTANDYFGQSVAVSLGSSNGGLIVVGAPGKNSNQGAAYVYQCTYSSPTYICSTSWVKITASDGATNHYFGSAVDVTGYTVVVTSRTNQKVYLFDCSAITSCIQISSELPSSTFNSITFSSRFGYTGAVAINEGATFVSVGDPLATVSSNADEGADITFGCAFGSTFPYCYYTPTPTATAPTSIAPSISTPTPTPSTSTTTTLYYQNNNWYSDPNGVKVQIWIYNATGQIGTVDLSKCLSTTNFWTGTIIQIQPNQQLLPVSFNTTTAQFLYKVDYSGCVSSQYYTGLNYANAVNEISTTSSNGCGGVVNNAFSGLIDGEMITCTPVQVTTLFVYYNLGWWNNASVQSVSLDLVTASYSIVLNKCSSPGYWFSLVAAYSPQSTLGFFLQAWTAADGSGSVSDNDYGTCGTINSYYIGTIDFTVPYNLLSSNSTDVNSNYCASTMSYPSNSPPSSGCPTLASTTFNYRNDMWAMDPSVANVVLLIFSADLKTSFSALLNRDGAFCWSGTATAANPTLTAQQVLPVAYDINNALLYRDQCSGSSSYYTLDFSQPFNGISTYGLCNGTITTSKSQMVCTSPTPTPTTTSTTPSTPTPTPTGIPSASGLSSGAIAGIVIGVVFCLLLTCLLASRRRVIRNTRLKNPILDSELLDNSDMNRIGSVSSLGTTTPTTFNGRVTSAFTLNIVQPAEERRNYADDLKKRSYHENDTIMNTRYEVALPGFLFMSMDQLQLYDVIAGGGNGMIKRGVVVDPAWKKSNPKFEEVAVKFVTGASADDEHNSLNFQQEVAAMNALSFHQNVVTLLGFCENPRAIILPLYKGDLYRYLHQEGSFATRPCAWTVFTALDIATQIASALMSMHSLNIVHRDIKPKNVLLEPISSSVSASGFPFRARVCDFGISRIVDNENRQDVKGMGSINVFGLSVQYAAPEVFSRMQLSSKGSFIDPEEEKKGDIYAFGITLWECVTEKIPYKGCSKDAVKQMVASGERPELPTDVLDGSVETVIRGQLVEIIESCWHQISNNRPDTRKVVAQLEKLQKEHIGTLVRQNNTLVRQPPDSQSSSMRSKIDESGSSSGQ